MAYVRHMARVCLAFACVVFLRRGDGAGGGRFQHGVHGRGGVIYYARFFFAMDSQLVRRMEIYFSGSGNLTVVGFEGRLALLSLFVACRGVRICSAYGHGLVLFLE
jgi:hypothetical protein